MHRSAIVKAIILSGGLGKRLRPITDYVPKSLVPVDNVPLIDWQIKYFKKFGITDFIVCAGHLSEALTSHLESKDFGIQVQYSIEKTPLGTGGAIKKAEKYIEDDRFFVINGDVITNMDLLKLQTYSNTIAVIPLRTPYGVIHVSGDKIDKFEEKPEIFNHWMNAGIYCLSKEVFDYLPKNGNIETVTFPALAKKGKLHVVKFKNILWNSIDSHKDIDECVISMKKTRYGKFLSE
jgi:mannose-1-phosphate guanylyltransferase